MPLAGPWKYRVERQTNAGALYSKPGELAAHVAFTAGGGLAGAAGAALKPVAPQAPDVVLRLAAVPGQMKFDLTELTVAPGQLVEIVFANPDAMQHNFVLGAPGSLDAIGAAADTLAQSPAGLAQQYVPDMPQVLFSTKLVEPGQTVTFQFRAPAAAGPLSVRLHVPRALARDERHPQRRPAAGTRRTGSALVAAQFGGLGSLAIGSARSGSELALIGPTGTAAPRRDQQRLRPERGAKPPRERWAWAPAH